MSGRRSRCGAIHANGGEMERTVTEEEYDEFLNEVYKPYKMGDLTFYASDILKSCDPVAYRTYKNDYEDSLEDE